MVAIKMNTNNYLNTLRVIKKSKDVAKEAVGGQAEDLLKLKDGQRPKETKKKKGWLDQEDQEAPLQVCWLDTLSGDKNQIIKFRWNPKQKSLSLRKKT